MKNFIIFFRVFVFVCISLLLLSCKKSKEDSLSTNNNPSTKTECYDVFDALDNHPIAGASVTMNHMTIWGYYLPYEGLTDISGHICNEYAADLPPTEELLVSKAGYLSKCPYTGVQTTVLLTPFAFVKLHLKNAIPANSADQISINYPASFCSMSYDIYFYGASVDTTMVMSVWTGARHIRWDANSVIKDSMVTFTSRDTVFFEILY
jgi:hypothetical protein